MPKQVLSSRAKQPKKRAVRIVRHYLRQWRKKRGLTQEQLAERIERTRGLVAQYESGETDIPESMIYALAHALSIDSWDLFRVNPDKEGDLVDITDELRSLDDTGRSEALGYIRGLRNRSVQ